MQRITVVDFTKFDEREIDLDKYVKGYYHIYKLGNNYFLYPVDMDSDRIWIDYEDQLNSFVVKTNIDFKYEYERVLFASPLRYLEDKEHLYFIKDKFEKKVNDKHETKVHLLNDVGVVESAIPYYYDERKAKYEEKIMKKHEIFAYPLGIKKNVFKKRFGLLKEDYVRAKWILDLLNRPEAGTFSYELGKLVLNMFQEGIGYHGLEPYDVIVRKNEYRLFELSLTEGEYAYYLSKGNPERMIFDEYDGIMMTMVGVLYRFIERLKMINESAMTYFLYGLGLNKDKVTNMKTFYDKNRRNRLYAITHISDMIASELYDELF